MAWIVLFLSGVLEAVWATALGKSEGFTKIMPTTIFVVALVASMLGLAYALRTLPVGAAYVIWVGVGAVLTVGYAIVTGTEVVSILKLVFLAMIISGIVGLKLLHN
jgi:quaternary ammonium compound-resistance protein SugE